MLRRPWPVLALCVSLATTTVACGAGGGRLDPTVVMAVALRDVGQDPRLLRYALRAGQVNSAELLVDLGIGIEIGGQSAPSTEIPATRIVIRTSVDEVGADGTFRIGFSFSEVSAVEEAGVDAALLAEVNRLLAPLTGVTGRYGANDRGAVLDAEIALPPDLDPTLASMLRQLESQLSTLSVPFPEEPVGVGATWDGAIALDVGGIRQEAFYRYEVVQVDGDRIRVAVSYEQLVPEQRAELPGRPAGATVDIRGGRIEGSGDVLVRLDSLLPEQSELTASGTIDRTADAGSDSVLTQTIDLSLTLRSLG